MVDGRFELIDPLGSGGMGTVWRAYDVALHREVALKEVRAAEPNGVASVQRERVLREARALARIGHPNVVAIHHIVDSPAETHPWIVMELVRGRSLADHLAAGPMAPAWTARIGQGILAGLRATHAAGVLHRDIKPANVLMREDGAPVLTDFGIAAIDGLEGLTSSGSVVGSLDYVAPERLGGLEGHPASDLWSLGLLLYAAVEGYHPLRRETSVATLAAVMAGDVPAPRQAGPLAPVLRAVLVPDPDRRPSAEHVDRMLSQAFAGSSGPWVVPPVPSSLSAPMMPSGPSAHSVSDPHTGTTSPPRRLWSGPSAHSVADPHTGTTSPPRRLWIVAVLVVVVCATVVAAFALWPRAARTSASAGSGESSSVPTFFVQPPSESTSPSAPQVGDLLTPDGILRAITALEQVTGGERFTETTFYPTFVDTGAPLQDQPTLYDEFTYREGKAHHVGPGGELTETETVNLRSVEWGALPALFQTAQDELGIPEPTSRYVIVDPAWTFNEDKPTVLVYLADDYGGAYLAADVDGSVVELMPRER
ncbi:serine/threonine-protein kinase [Nocardia sp. CNY236]|uniref:serine/threonine-protein kinase n=1 Tax=Nocardia sp. CNY236 TaxID=1169152 RepID=UPI00040DE991|nr:serine/threonine-protein kinase [Nocardia sp. CNY236]